MSFSLSGGRGDVEMKGSEHFGSALHYLLFESFVLHTVYEHSCKFKCSYQVSLNGEKTNTRIFAIRLPTWRDLNGSCLRGDWLLSINPPMAYQRRSMGIRYSRTSFYWGGEQYWKWTIGSRLSYSININSDVNGQTRWQRLCSVWLFDVQNERLFTLFAYRAAHRLQCEFSTLGLFVWARCAHSNVRELN